MKTVSQSFCFFRTQRLCASLVCAGVAAASVPGLAQSKEAAPVQSPGLAGGIAQRATTVPDSRVLVPPVRQHRTAKSIAVPRTVAELNAELNDYYISASEDWLHVDRLAGLPVDSIYKLVRARARHIAATVGWDTVRGKQADAGLEILIRAGDTTRMPRLLARRLAEPGLRVQDSAYTLMLVVGAYARRTWPADLVHAELYTKRLDALSAKAAFWQAQAHQTLAMQHYVQWHPADVLAHMEQVVRAMGRMDYLSRRSYQAVKASLIWVGLLYPLAASTDVAPLVPNGVARLEALMQQMQELAMMPASLTSMCSSIRRIETSPHRGPGMAAAALKARKPLMPPLFGTIWRNIPDTASHALKFGDGHVYVVRRVGCKLLPAAARSLERLLVDVPELRVVLYCANDGVWGNIFVTPEEEIASLQARLDQELHSKIPIAIWIGKKVKNQEGGWVPMSDTTADAFEYWDAILIDRQGRRRPLIYDVGAGPGEGHLLQIAQIRQVLAEPASAPGTSVAPPPPPSGAGTVSATASRVEKRS
jgi:hypothetical protein